MIRRPEQKGGGAAALLVCNCALARERERECMASTQHPHRQPSIPTAVVERKDVCYKTTRGNWIRSSPVQWFPQRCSQQQQQQRQQQQRQQQQRQRDEATFWSCSAKVNFSLIVNCEFNCECDSGWSRGACGSVLCEEFFALISKFHSKVPRLAENVLRTHTQRHETETCTQTQTHKHGHTRTDKLRHF